MRYSSGEDKAIAKKLIEYEKVYKKRGYNGLIELCVHLYIEVRRLSTKVEKLNKELRDAARD